MKKIRIIFICAFFVIIAVPIITFNWKENVVSEIDNRELTNNPFGDNYVSDGSTDLTDAIEDYLQDRIGLRDEMITAYTVLNDRLFHEMVHPTYEYGKDGYVFGKTGNNVVFSDYHVQFADMVEKIQTYCEERSIPFVFVFDPSKSTVLWETYDGIFRHPLEIPHMPVRPVESGVPGIFVFMGSSQVLPKTRRSRRLRVVNRVVRYTPVAMPRAVSSRPSPTPSPCARSSPASFGCWRAP